MLDSDSIFLRFNLPNATSWFYFSLLLAVAIFFKFSRLLSVRNLDVLTLFLLVPGLLLLQESHRSRLAYLWLLGGSGWFLARCLFDLTLVRRPALNPNLNFGGLAWLAGALFVCLVVVALRPGERPAEPAAREPPLIQRTQQEVEKLVPPKPPAGDAADFDAALWARRILAIACHLAIVLGLMVVGWRHFQNPHAGMAAATFYLLLPYTAMDIRQWHYAWPMALTVWAVAAYRRPTLAGLLLGLAAGTVYFPLLIVPVWLSFYRGRGAGRFAGAFTLVAGLCLAALWLSDDLFRGLQQALAVPDWQPWRLEPIVNSEGVWRDIHWAYRMPVFIAYLTFVVATAFWPTPKNLGHVLALSAAALIGMQFWYADRGGMYVLWYLPLLLLLVFRPNLSDRLPPAVQPETDWLHRLGRALARLAQRGFRLLLPVPPSPAGRR
jgi:hypothetical protein